MKMIKKISKDKRGFELTLKTVLGMVIGVICLLILAGFISRLISGAVNQDEQNARQIMLGENGILAEIRRINAGWQANEQGFFVANPTGWYLFGFAGEEFVKTPNMCAGQRCICICQKVAIDTGDNQLKRCDKNAACGIVENLKAFGKIKIEAGGISLLFKQDAEKLIEVVKK